MYLSPAPQPAPLAVKFHVPCSGGGLLLQLPTRDADKPRSCIKIILKFVLRKCTIQLSTWILIVVNIICAETSIFPLPAPSSIDSKIEYCKN